MPFGVFLFPGAWNADVPAGAPATLLVHKVTLSMEASARMVEQKSQENLGPCGNRAVNTSYPRLPVFKLFEKEINTSCLSHYSFGFSVICNSNLN